MIRYFLRKPAFPVLCDVDGVLIGARSHRKLESELSALNLDSGKEYPVVEATGQGWVLNTDHMIVSPIIWMKRWTKKEIVHMFNGSITARQSDMRYPEKSLGNKRLDRIVGEIVDMILNANKRSQPRTRRRSAKIGLQKGSAPLYTPRQGQYLAFIYYFTKIHRLPPSEAEMQQYFRVTPPTVHQMVLLLESKGFVARMPGKARSIQLLVDPAELPDLE